MYEKKRLSIALLVSLIALVGFVCVTFFIRLDQVISFDEHALLFISEYQHPILTKIMIFFSFIGSTSTVIVLILTFMLIQYKFLHHRKEILLVGGVLLGTALLNIALKLLFQRVRPDITRLIEETGYSFPSGHSMVAFSFYCILAFVLWRHIPTKSGRILLLLISSLMIITIGFSRLYLGVHYPSDVIGAFLVSCFLVFLCIWFFQRQPRSESKLEKSS